ncbi:MAG: PIN domain-containing protein [Actinomycetes bacterium]
MKGIVTLDAGILVALERDDRRARATLASLVRSGWLPTVPAVVVAEVWRGPRQARLARVLGASRIEPLDEATARRAGLLNARAGRDDPVDAVVVVTAATHGGQLWTLDPDLRELAEHLPAGGPPLTVRVDR